MDQRHALGGLLRRLRIQAGLSQEELGSAAGVDARTISDLERSVTSYPRAKTAQRITDALGLSGAERENWLSLASPAASPVSTEPPAETAAGFTASTLAQAVSDLRQQRGISARELSERTRLTARTIADIEAGRRKRVHQGNAVRLADELGLADGARERFLRLAAGEAIGEPALPAVNPVTLVGREREAAEVAGLLLSSRLVIMTGPGGVGKTTLAEAVLAGLDRPHLALDLTRVPPGEDLARAIAIVCQFDEGADDAWIGQLGALLPSGAVLFLDNLEHLRGVADAVGAILASRPDRTVLATSRTLSGLDAAAEYPVGPLPVPAACQVFQDTARRSGRPLAAKFPAELIEQVCVRLDLLPLTIILAATWSRLMTPPEILARLDRSTEILRVPQAPGRGQPDEQVRHSAVVSTVEWSLALVSEPARALFRALSAYPAPWPLDLVEAVGPADRLHRLHELVEAGLVSAADNAAGGTSYSMLQTVRAVGDSELNGDLDRRDEVLARHSAHVIRRAAELGPKLFTAERPAALVECDQYAPHVQGAFEYLIRSADRRAVDLTGAWWNYWFHRGQYRRGLAVVARAVEVRADAPARDLATALYGAAALAYYGGENQEAADYAARSLELARAAGDTERIGTVISLIGMMEFYAGHQGAALDWYQRGLAEVDSEAHPRTYATLLTNAAPVYAVLGDIKAAREAAEDAARRCQALDNQAGVAANLGNLADWAARVGDRDRARELLSECRGLLASLGDSYNVIQSILSLGKLAADEGDAATAQEELDTARQLIAETDDPWGDALADALAAQVAVLNGNMPAAHGHAQLALRKGKALEYQPAIVAAALADAAAAAWSGDWYRTLESAERGLNQSQQADEAAVVSLALLVAAVHVDTTSPARLGDDVLALERMVRRWAAVPGGAPYPIAVRSARRRGLRLTPGEQNEDAPPIKEVRHLALALCDPESGGR
jgi:predicted ATPase/DNA-binding XRE family transcriptional regulator